VIFLVFGENSNVIKIDHNGLIDETMKRNIHFSLEGGPNIYKPKRHLPVGISAPWGMKGGF